MCLLDMISLHERFFRRFPVHRQTFTEMGLCITILDTKLSKVFRQDAQVVRQQFCILVEINKNKAAPRIDPHLSQAVSVRRGMREVPCFR